MPGKSAELPKSPRLTDLVDESYDSNSHEKCASWIRTGQGAK